MEQKNAEQNQPKLEVIREEQKFQLFKPERTLPRKKGRYETRIGLVLEGLPVLGIGLRLVPNDKAYPYPVELSFSLSEPEKGYIITNEDLNPAKRAEKVDMIKNKPLSPHSLEYLDFITRLDNREGDPNLYSSYGTFKPEVMEILKRLRFRILSPKAFFEAKPDESEIDVGEISFFDFYPVDAGPLPTSGKGGTEGSEGIDIAFPINFEDIQKINGVFFIEDEARGGEK